MSEQGLPSDDKRRWEVSGSQPLISRVKSVHRISDGHRVSCEGHLCPSTQCPLYSLSKDLTAELVTCLVNSSQTHGVSFLLWNEINVGHFQARLFWLFLSLNQVALYLPTPALSQSPHRREEIRLSWASHAPWLGRGITNEQDLPGSLRGWIPCVV